MRNQMHSSLASLKIHYIKIKLYLLNSVLYDVKYIPIILATGAFPFF